MSQLNEMLERKENRPALIQDNVRHAGGVIMARNGDYGNRQMAAVWSVHGNQSIHGPAHEELSIVLEKFFLMSVAHDEVEVSGLKEMILDAAHDEGCITLADFGNDYADREASLLTQRTGGVVWAAVVQPRRFQDPVSCGLRNGFGHGRFVDDEGYRGWREIEQLRQRFLTDRLFGD